MNTIVLQTDEYLGDDGLAYCKNCHTPRVCRIEDSYFPVACKCREETYKKAENERKLHERKVKAEEYRRNSALGKHFRNCTFETATIINAKKPTIYSSNYRISALMANCNYEERTAHRIKGSCLFERQLDCENMRDLVRKRNEKKLLKFITGDI